MGILFEMENTDIPAREDTKNGLIKDHKAFIAYANKLIYDESGSNCVLCARTYDNPTTTMDRDRLDDIPDRKAVTITGLTPVLHDVSDSIYRQAITSAGSGCMAALDAEKYLDK